MRILTSFIFLLTGLSLVFCMRSPADQASDLAVIVNKRTTVLALTSRDLRSIFLGEKDRWPNGQKLLAASLPPEVPETKFLLKQICGMSEADFKRYYMQLAFQGKPATPPKFLTSSAAVKALVSATPGALGVIPARDVDASVNVLALDGGSPGQPNYKLMMN